MWNRCYLLYQCHVLYTVRVCIKRCSYSIAVTVGKIQDIMRPMDFELFQIQKTWQILKGNTSTLWAHLFGRRPFGFWNIFLKDHSTTLTVQATWSIMIRDETRTSKKKTLDNIFFMYLFKCICNLCVFDWCRSIVDGSMIQSSIEKIVENLDFYFHSEIYMF